RDTQGGGVTPPRSAGRSFGVAEGEGSSLFTSWLVGREQAHVIPSWWTVTRPCASQPTRCSGGARRSTPASISPLRRRFAPPPPRPAGRRLEQACLDHSGHAGRRCDSSPLGGEVLR